MTGQQALPSHENPACSRVSNGVLSWSREADGITTGQTAAEGPEGFPSILEFVPGTNVQLCSCLFLLHPRLRTAFAQSSCSRVLLT